MSIVDALKKIRSRLTEKRIRSAIRKKYDRVAQCSEGLFDYPTGRNGAELLGYEKSILDNAADGILRSFCGVGNPFSLGEIVRDEVVLDIGCGGGFDLYVARYVVGGKETVYGLDITPAMVATARRNLQGAGVMNFDVRQGCAEEIPFNSKMFDVVLSNGVLNLSPRKDRAFGEIFRVLKPGGRLQFADVVLKNEIPAALRGSAESWSQ